MSDPAATDAADAEHADAAAATDVEAADGGTDPETDTDTPTEPMSDTTDDDTVPFANVDADRLRALVDRVALVALLLFALFAGLQFYGAASSAISIWVSRPYEPLVRAAFNLGLLLLALAGIGVQLRRLAADAGGN